MVQLTQFRSIVPNDNFSCFNCGKKFTKEEVRAIVCGQNELKIFIFNNNENRNFSYFVMTESGKTFEKL